MLTERISAPRQMLRKLSMTPFLKNANSNSATHHPAGLPYR
jgi:hypothetical protein